MVRGAYTRAEYRSGSTVGLSRKTRIYRHVTAKSIDPRNILMETLPEHNVFFLYPRGYHPEFGTILDAYERFQKEWTEQEAAGTEN